MYYFLKMDGLNPPSILERYQQKLYSFFNDLSKVRKAYFLNYSENLEKIFNELSIRYRVLKEVKNYLNRFLASDFNLVGIFNPDEIRLSGILAQILNPQGKHGQGDLFLREFLKTLRGFIPNSQTLNVSGNLNSSTVSTEYSTNYGRLDILIELPNGGVIAIENKPWAGEQREQLQGYVNWLEKTFNGKYLLVFLSGQKTEATSIEKSLKRRLKEEGKFLEISYGELLKPWLLKCAKECESDKVRWFLRDFATWIEKTFKEG